MLERIKKLKLVQLGMHIAELTARYEILHTAAGIAYYFMLAVFPFLMFLAALVGVVQFPPEALQSAVQPLLSKPVAEAVLAYYAYLQSVSNRFSLLFGLVFSLYSASRAVQALTYGVNKVYETRERRSWLRNLLHSVVFTIGISAVLLAALLVVSLSGSLPAWLVHNTGASMQWRVYRIVLVSAYSVLTTFYCIAPLNRVRLRYALCGSTLCLAGMHLISFGVSIYARISTRFSVLYGSIGAIIVLLLWLYLFGVCVLAGAMLNRFLENKKALE